MVLYSTYQPGKTLLIPAVCGQLWQVLAPEIRNRNAYIFCKYLVDRLGQQNI